MAYPDPYRGFRGLVHHVMRRWNSRDRWGNLTYDIRKPAAGIGSRRKLVYDGRCIWCRLPALNPRTGRKLRWHKTCAWWQGLAAGQHLKTRGLNLPLICPCGNRKVTAMDHLLAIGIAHRLGPKPYALAFLPSNLHWVCGKCHREKTKFDRAVMRMLDEEDL